MEDIPPDVIPPDPSPGGGPSELKEAPLLALIEEFKSKKEVHEIFGVILYTEANPLIVKLLRDEDYWKALDKNSGLRWPLFSVRAALGQTTIEIPRSKPGVMTLMRSIPIWNEPSQNENLLQFFGMEDTRDLPLLLVFMESFDGEILRISFKISGDTVEASYKSLNMAIQVIVGAIDRVTEENIKNTAEIFALMSSAHSQHVLVEKGKKVLSIVEWIKSWK